MKTYAFTVMYYKTINKTVTVQADDIFEAQKLVKQQYPSYQVYAKPTNTAKRLF